jgi:hypothetical protein
MHTARAARGLEFRSRSRAGLAESSCFGRRIRTHGPFERGALICGWVWSLIRAVDRRGLLLMELSHRKELTQRVRLQSIVTGMAYFLL